MQLFYIGYH